MAKAGHMMIDAAIMIAVLVNFLITPLGGNDAADQHQTTSAGLSWTSYLPDVVGVNCRIIAIPRRVRNNRLEGRDHATGIRKLSPAPFQVHYTNFTSTAGLAVLTLMPRGRE
jgi:hypothetical protein